MYHGSFPGVKRLERDVIIIHTNQVPRLKMSGPIPLLPLDVDREGFIHLAIYGQCIVMYFNNYPLHVSNRLAIHHQESVYCICSL